MAKNKIYIVDDNLFTSTVYTYRSSLDQKQANNILYNKIQ